MRSILLVLAFILHFPDQVKCFVTNRSGVKLRRATTVPILPIGSLPVLRFSRRYSSSDDTPSPKEEEGATEEYDEVTKYRNRAALAEHVLKKKMEDMKTMQGKLVVLQDVVTKLKAKTDAKSKEEGGEGLELRQQFLTEQLVRQKAENDLQELTANFRKERLELEATNADYQKELESLQNAYNADRSRWKKERKDQQNQNKELQKKIKALQKELLEMDSSFEATQQDLIDVQKKLDRKDELARQALQREIKNAENLQAELEIVTKERDAALALLTANTTAGESIEIATAAVRAAEKRQAEADAKLADLKVDYEDMSSEKKALQELLTVAEEEKDALEEALEEALRKAAAEESLRSEIDSLTEELGSAKAQFEEQREKDDERAKKELTSMQDEYEKRIVELEAILAIKSQSPLRRILSSIRKRFGR